MTDDELKLSVQITKHIRACFDSNEGCCDYQDVIDDALSVFPDVVGSVYDQHCGCDRNRGQYLYFVVGNNDNLESSMLIDDALSGR